MANVVGKEIFAKKKSPQCRVSEFYCSRFSFGIPHNAGQKIPHNVSFFTILKGKKSSPLSRIFKRINLTLWGRNLANDILHCEEEKNLENSPQCRIFHLMTPTLWGSMMITLKFGHFPTMKDFQRICILHCGEEKFLMTSYIVGKNHD